MNENTNHKQLIETLTLLHKSLTDSASGDAACELEEENGHHMSTWFRGRKVGFTLAAGWLERVIEREKSIAKITAHGGSYYSN
jgi:hypothetical protein